MPQTEVFEIPIVFTEDTNGLTKAKQAIDATNQATQEFQKTVEQAVNDLVNSGLDEQALKIAAIGKAQAQLNKVRDLEAQILLSQKGSYNQLSAQLELIKTRLQQMSAAQIKNTKEGKELRRQFDATSKELSKFDKSTGGLLDKMEEMPGALGRAGGGVQSLGRSFKALLANPVVLFLSLIAAGLYALFNAFKSSEKGAQLMTKATGIMNGLFSFTVKITESIAEAIESFANDPLAAIKDLGQAIIDNLINRFQATIDIVTSTGQAIKSLLTGNMEDFKAAANDAKTAVIQLATGLDKAQQQNFADALAEATDEALRQVDAFIKLEQARKAVASSNRELAKSIAELQTVEELNRSIADDATKSFAEREAAAEKSREALEKRALREIQIAKNNLGLINQELNLRKANGEAVTDLLDQQLSAYQAFMGAERAYTLAVRENEKQRAELKQDRLEKDLDILIDGFDNQKAVNERIIKDEEQAFEKRQALLEETRKLSDETFQKQIETIQQFTGAAVDGNELVAESDAIVLNQKIRSLGLSEIIEGRLLEVVRERRTAMQDLAEAEKELGISRAKQAAEELKRQNELKELMRKLEIQEFEQLQELEKSKFDLVQRTAAERAEFELKQEREKLQKILDLNREFNDGLTDEQIQSIENQISGIDKALKKVPSIFEKAQREIIKVLDISEEQFKELLSSLDSTLSSALGSIFDGLGSLFEAQLSQQDKVIDKQREQVDSLQDALDEELKLREQGLANNSDLLQKQLTKETEILKAEEEKRLEIEKKAAKLRLRQEALQTASNIALSVAKVISAESSKGLLGIVTAIAAVASIFALMAKAKAQAAQFANPDKLRKGAKLKGKKHEQGGVPLLADGNLYEAEAGEWLVGSAPSKEHDNFLERLNRGDFHGEDLNRHINFSRDFFNDPKNMIASLAPEYGVPVLPDYLANAIPKLRETTAASREAKAANEKAVMVEVFAEMFGRMQGGLGSVERAIREQPLAIPITPDGYIIKDRQGNTENVRVYAAPKRRG